MSWEWHRKGTYAAEKQSDQSRRRAMALSKLLDLEMMDVGC